MSTHYLQWFEMILSISEKLINETKMLLENTIVDEEVRLLIEEMIWTLNEALASQAWRNEMQKA